MLEQFDHRPIDHAVVGPAGRRVARAAQPVPHGGRAGLHRHVDMGRGGDFVLHGPAQLQHGLEIARRRGLLGGGVGPAGIGRRHRHGAVDGGEELDVIGVLGPERAVIVEHRHAVLRGHEALGTGIDRLRHEGEDGAARRPFVPGRQRLRRSRGEGRAQREQDGEEHLHGGATSRGFQPAVTIAIACTTVH